MVFNHHKLTPTIVDRKLAQQMKKNGEEASLKQLIDVFKREQTATEVTYQQPETGVISPPQKK